MTAKCPTEKSEKSGHELTDPAFDALYIYIYVFFFLWRTVPRRKILEPTKLTYCCVCVISPATNITGVTKHNKSCGIFIHLHYNITANYRDNSNNNIHIIITIITNFIQNLKFVRQKQRKYLADNQSGLETSSLFPFTKSIFSQLFWHEHDVVRKLIQKMPPL